MKAITRERGIDVALTVLRVVVGVIFIVHGAMKLTDIAGTASGFESMGIPIPTVAVYLAILGEFFGGIGLALGLLTPLAALGPLCVMIFAIAYVHVGHGLLASNNGWEYPLILLLVSLVFVVKGGGPYSLDALIKHVGVSRHPEHTVAVH